jgi:tRNA (cytidine/uridine-2'-O-)-methyltransferase
MRIVLYEPDIPWNTGNVGRTCLATGTSLHLVGKLGFDISEAGVKRAGLDYWSRVPWQQHREWSDFLAFAGEDAPLFFFSKKGKRSFWQATFPRESYLIFGCETKGLPDRLLEPNEDRVYAVPMEADSVRSLNLSTAVGIVLYEALRQNNYHGAFHSQKTR